MQPNVRVPHPKLVMGVLIGVLVLMALYIGFKRPSPLHVVDMNRAIQIPSTMLAHSKLSKAQQATLMSRFSSRLPEVIKEYGQEHLVTIISATVLESHGGVDITNLIVARTIERVKHEPS